MCYVSGGSSGGRSGRGYYKEKEEYIFEAADVYIIDSTGQGEQVAE